MLLAETHLTSKNLFKIYGYTCYNNNHPEDKSCGGTAILIKNRIKHFPLYTKQSKSIQYTAIRITETCQEMDVVAVYCPPKYNIKSDEFVNLFKVFKKRSIIAGDFNAKSPLWGSRLTTPKGRQLVQAINKENLNCYSNGTPTYWPTDRRKIPDVIDSIITRKINPSQITTAPSLDLSSDHSPTLITLVLGSGTTRSETVSKSINWIKFQKLFKRIFNPQMKSVLLNSNGKSVDLPRPRDGPKE